MWLWATTSCLRTIAGALKSGLGSNWFLAYNSPWASMCLSSKTVVSILAHPKSHKGWALSIPEMRDDRWSHDIDEDFEWVTEIYLSGSMIHISFSQIDDCGRSEILDFGILKSQTFLPSKYTESCHVSTWIERWGFASDDLTIILFFGPLNGIHRFAPPILWIQWLRFTLALWTFALRESQVSNLDGFSLLWVQSVKDFHLVLITLLLILCDVIQRPLSLLLLGF